jgi:hypothetical protein
MIADPGAGQASADLAIWDVERPAELVLPDRRQLRCTSAFSKEPSHGMITLIPGAGLAATLAGIYRATDVALLETAARPAVERAAARIAEVAAGGAPVYGVNTGFGKLASMQDQRRGHSNLQRNLILSAIAAASANRWRRPRCG